MTDPSTARALVEKLREIAYEQPQKYCDAILQAADFIEQALTPPEGDTVSDEVVELIKQLRAPKQWCCIFEHEGQMRHGTTDAPFKAAAALQSSVSPNCASAAMIDQALASVKEQT